MVAGFLAGLIKGNDYESALKMGAAAGSATAFSECSLQKKIFTGFLKNFKPEIIMIGKEVNYAHSRFIKKRKH